MQRGVTVALVMVWLADLVGVLSTSTPLPPVDQYSPRLPENRHGVARGPQDLGHRKLSHRRQDPPIYVTFNDRFLRKGLLPERAKNGTPDVHRDGRPGTRDVYSAESASFTDNLRGRSSVILEKPEVGFGDRGKRSLRLLSLENRYLVQGLDPLLAIEFGTEEEDEDEDGQYYEEMDELVRVRQDEKTDPRKVPSRGDIPVVEEESTGTSDVPVRGDIGAANALAMTTSKPRSARNLQTLMDVYASVRGQRSAGLQKRETNDFSRKAGSSWDLGEKERTYAARKRKPKGEKHKKRKNPGYPKRNQGGRRRVVERGQRKSAMGRGQTHRIHAGAYQNEELLERKLQEYIRRNTPIDVRRNRGYDPWRREGDRRDPNSRDYDQRTHVPEIYWRQDQRLTDGGRMRHSGEGQGQRRQGGNNQDPRLKYDRRYDNQQQYNQRTTQDPRRQYNQNTPLDTDQRQNRTEPRDRTEGVLERGPLDSNSVTDDRRLEVSRETPVDHRRAHDARHHGHDPRQPYDHRNVQDPRQPYDSRQSPDSRSRGQDPRQPYDPRQHHDPRQHAQDPRQHQDPRYHTQDPRHPHDPRSHTQDPRQPHDPRLHAQDPRHPHDPRHHPEDSRQTHDPRHHPQDPRRPHDSRYRPEDSRLPYDSKQIGTHPNINQTRPVNVRRPYDPRQDRLDDYIRRNTPVDVRPGQSYAHARPYQPRIDTGRSVPGSVPERSSNEPNQRRNDFSSSTPVDRDSQRRHGSDTRNSTPGERSRYHQRPSHLQNARIGQQDRWTVAEHEQRPEDDRGRAQEQETRYQEFQRNSAYYPADFDKYLRTPVSARIYINPHRRSSRYRRDVEYAPIDPNHKGVVVADQFPVPATRKPPVESPSLCVWAVIKCCPNSTRRKNCFEAHGCPEISWDPDPCRKAVRDAARDEIRNFYERSEGAYA